MIVVILSCYTLRLQSGMRVCVIMRKWIIYPIIEIPNNEYGFRFSFAYINQFEYLLWKDGMKKKKKQ